jgi:hypothetical protein
LDFKKQGDVEALKRGNGGGWNIEGALKTVDLEKICLISNVFRWNISQIAYLIPMS